MDDEEEYEEFFHASRRFRRADVAVLTIGFVRGVIGSAFETLSTLESLVAAHANYECDQDDFRQEAARAIETITGEETDG